MSQLSQIDSHVTLLSLAPAKFHSLHQDASGISLFITFWFWDVLLNVKMGGGGVKMQVK